jgi:hypothetical protein
MDVFFGVACVAGAMLAFAAKVMFRHDRVGSIREEI